MFAVITGLVEELEEDLVLLLVLVDEDVVEELSEVVSEELAEEDTEGSEELYEDTSALEDEDVDVSEEVLSGGLITLEEVL